MKQNQLEIDKKVDEAFEKIDEFSTTFIPLLEKFDHSQEEFKGLHEKESYAFKERIELLQSYEKDMAEFNEINNLGIITLDSQAM